MKKVIITQNFIIIEEEKKKIFGGVNVIKKEVRLDDIISIGKIQENGNIFAVDIMLKDNDVTSPSGATQLSHLLDAALPLYKATFKDFPCPSPPSTIN